ncbi:MAG: helix-turn-helix domain-containing protein [Rhizobiaceae bacterium]|nr:helix-turn-helix domain-containing protein [Rhizobiaceae bacterium]
MYSIGEVSKRSGVNIETIRYYEREGIVPGPDRLANGRRTYDDKGLAALRFVKKCRDLGFTMHDAKALLSLATDSGMNCGQVRPIAEAHLAIVVRKMEELARLRDALTRMVAECGDPASECPILNVLSGPEDVLQAVAT